MTNKTLNERMDIAEETLRQVVGRLDALLGSVLVAKGRPGRKPGTKLKKKLKKGKVVDKT